MDLCQLWSSAETHRTVLRLLMSHRVGVTFVSLGSLRWGGRFHCRFHNGHWPSLRCRFCLGSLGFDDLSCRSPHTRLLWSCLWIRKLPLGLIRQLELRGVVKVRVQFHKDPNPHNYFQISKHAKAQSHQHLTNYTSFSSNLNLNLSAKFYTLFKLQATSTFILKDQLEDLNS